MTTKPHRSLPLAHGHHGTEVRALQHALNARAVARRYPALVADGELGAATWRAWKDIGYSLGFMPETLDADAIPIGAQGLLVQPQMRSAAQLARARARSTGLTTRSITMDGTPLFWGLAAPLVEARAHGWSGQVTSGDRRSGVAERFGKKSQAKLFSCFQARKARGVCPGPCGGDCLPANPPGRSSHELCSDGVAFTGPVGRELPWWQLGLDVSQSDQLLHILTALGYGVRRPYNTPSEFHHVNFTRNPGPVIPPGHGHGQGQAQSASHAQRPRRPRPVVTHTGPDVSMFQGDVNWKEVRHAGHGFAFVKATEGKDYVDPRFGHGRWAAMLAAGLRRGVYHFARPQSGRPPSIEAHHFLATVHQAGGFAKGDLPPVLDLEWSRGLTPSAVRAWAIGWLDEVRKATGVRPLLYTGEWFWHGSVGNSSEPVGYPLWLAAYVRDPRPFVPPPWRHTGPALWQYTDRAHCPGIPGPCDMSRFRGDPATFRRLGFQ